MRSGPLTLGHGTRRKMIAVDPQSELLVTGDLDGVVRVGPLSGEDPHLLLGHSSHVYAATFSRVGRWIFTGAESEIRMWPVPDLARPRLHAVDRNQLVDVLRDATNLRAVEDPASSTGWRVAPAPPEG